MFPLPFSVRSKKFCSCKQLARAKCCSCRQNLHVQHCSSKRFRTNNDNSLHVQVLFCSSKFVCVFSRYETLHVQNAGSFRASGVSKISGRSVPSHDTESAFVFSGHIVHSNNHGESFQSTQRSFQMIQELKSDGIDSEIRHSDLFFHRGALVVLEISRSSGTR